MKKYNRKQEERKVNAIYQRSPNGVLVIKGSFYEYLMEHDSEITIEDVCSNRSSNKTVVTHSTTLLTTLIRLASKDVVNFRRSFAYVKKNYPHAIFSFDAFTIAVENLFPEEIKDCLGQKGMSFKYYKLS